MPSIIKPYLILTKPGIVRGNVIVATAGYLFAANGHIQSNLLPFIIGTAAIIAAGCVANNYLDRDIDAKMQRTKKRPSVSGAISNQNIIIFSLVLLTLGLLLLGVMVNLLTLFIGIFGFLTYVFVYGYFKRRTPLGTLIGTIPGATPPLAGYAAASGLINTPSIILFFVLVFWQMPHFYAISIFRLKEYKKAGAPLLPVVKGILATKYQMVFYLGLFGLVTGLLFYLGYTGYVYIVGMFISYLWWVKLAIKGLKYNEAESDKWAKKMFGRSLAVLMVFSLLISFNFLLF